MEIILLPFNKLSCLLHIRYVRAVSEKKLWGSLMALLVYPDHP